MSFFVLEKISKEVCYNVENSSMGFCYMSLPIASGNERELSMQSFCCFVSPKLSRLNPAKPTVRNQSTQWGVMVPSQCLSMLLLMVWYVVSSAHKVKTTFNFFSVVLALMEWILSKCYFGEIFSAIPWRCNKRFKVLTILNSWCLCKSAKTTTKQKMVMVG